MISSYTVIDVETPNCKNDSICSIALICVENNMVISREYYLVNPEDRFDSINMSIHNISKAMVIEEPNFPEIWNRISGYFTNGIIVAHNASFDLSVINKTLRKYKIVVPEFQYLCTLKLSKSTFPDFDKYNLKCICSSFGIDLNEHHNALCDAIACQKIYNFINMKNPILKKHIQIYHLKDQHKKKIEKPILVKSLNALYGVVKGITCDNIINTAELKFIKEWINEYDEFSDIYPYSQINPKINAILADGIITEDEKNELIKISEMYICAGNYSEKTLSLQILKGILEGISCDDEVTLLELEPLNQWMIENAHLKGIYPFDVVFSTINKVMEDRIITIRENEELIKLFKNFIEPCTTQNEEKTEMCFCISEKTVCLTGNFVNGTKSEIGERIIANNGVVSASVTKKTNILVVGGEGSKDWSFGNFGTKVKKAMELKSKGSEIEIFGEEDFLQLIKMTD